MVAHLKLAITGATGFVGSRLLALALEGGHEVRALARRPQDERQGVSWIEGALDRPDRLEQLLEGTRAVIHVAGVINAPDAAGFEAGNVAGTAAVIAAAKKVGTGRFIHVSSLAAREPGLSVYGETKARSEQLVSSSGLDWSIVRPPAVYGPGDRETLDLFRMAKSGLVLLPPAGRLSLIHVDDLGQLLISLAASEEASGLVLEPDDGRAGGWTHGEFGKAIGQALGRRVVGLPTPRPVLDICAKVDRLVRRGRAKLTPDRVAYFCHPDWAVDPGRKVPARLWTPRVDTRRGLAETVGWYRKEGWL